MSSKGSKRMTNKQYDSNLQAIAKAIETAKTVKEAQQIILSFQTENEPGVIAPEEPESK